MIRMSDYCGCGDSDCQTCFTKATRRQARSVGALTWLVDDVVALARAQRRGLLDDVISLQADIDRRIDSHYGLDSGIVYDGR